MDSKTLEEEKELQKIQHEHEAFIQANQAAIDGGTKALNALFLLNGATATALFANEQINLKAPAILFAIGALLAILSLALWHYFNLKVAAALRGERWPAYNSCLWHILKRAGKTENPIGTLRAVLVVASAIPAIIFIIGIIRAAAVV